MLALGLTLGLVLGGCGSKDDDKQTQAPVEKTETEPEKAAEPEAEPVPEEENTEIEGVGDYISECPEVEMSRSSLKYTDENDNLIISCAYNDSIEVFSGYYDVDVLNDLLKEECDTNVESIENEYEVLKDLYDNSPEELGKIDDPNPYIAPLSLEIQMFPTRRDGKVISFRKMVSEFGGDYRTGYVYSGLNYSVQNQQLLGIEDVIYDMEGFMDYAYSEAANQLDAWDDGLDILYDGADEVAANINSCEWYLNASGIDFVINPGEVADEEYGAVAINFPYHEILDYINPDFIPNTEDGILELEKGEVAQATEISGMLVSFENEGGPNADGYSYLKVDENGYTVTEAGYIDEISIYKRLDGVYIFTNYTIAGGRECFSVFDISDGSIREIYSKTDAFITAYSLSQEAIEVTYDSLESEFIPVTEIIPDK